MSPWHPPKTVPGPYGPEREEDYFRRMLQRTAPPTTKPGKQPKTVAAIATLRERTKRRVDRCAELTREGRTAKQIARIIADEEGEAAAFPVSTVKGWRRRSRGSKP